MFISSYILYSVSPYSVQMRENVDQNNSEYGHFLRSEIAEQFRTYDLRKWGTFKAVYLSFHWIDDLRIWTRNSWIWTRNSWI